MPRSEKIIRATVVAAAVGLFVGLVVGNGLTMLLAAVGLASGVIWLSSRPQSDGWICQYCGASGAARTHDEAVAAYGAHLREHQR